MATHKFPQRPSRWNNRRRQRTRTTASANLPYADYEKISGAAVPIITPDPALPTKSKDYVVLLTRILLRSDADFNPCTDGNTGAIDMEVKGTAQFVKKDQKTR